MSLHLAQIRDILYLEDAGLFAVHLKLANNIRDKYINIIEKYSIIDAKDKATSDANEHSDCDKEKMSLLNEILECPEKSFEKYDLPGRDGLLANLSKEKLPSGMFEGQRTIKDDLDKVIARSNDTNDLLTEKEGKLKDQKDAQKR